MMAFVFTMPAGRLHPNSATTPSSIPKGISARSAPQPDDGRQAAIENARRRHRGGRACVVPGTADDAVAGAEAAGPFSAVCAAAAAPTDPAVAPPPAGAPPGEACT